MLAVGERVLGSLDDRIVRMMTGFGGGIGGTHEELCGAFVASVMIASGLYGRLSAEEDDTPAYEAAAELRRRFAEHWGHLRCDPIREAVRHPDGSSGCDRVVAETVHILLDFLEETGR